MDRAQKTAVRICPVGKNEGKLCYSPDDVRKAAMSAYYQAEKDLALTWEDMQTICNLTYDVLKENNYVSLQGKYTEVLKRFLESKKK